MRPEAVEKLQEQPELQQADVKPETEAEKLQEQPELHQADVKPEDELGEPQDETGDETPATEPSQVYEPDAEAAYGLGASHQEQVEDLDLLAKTEDPSETVDNVADADNGTETSSDSSDPVEAEAAEGGFFSSFFGGNGDAEEKVNPEPALDPQVQKPTEDAEDPTNASNQLDSNSQDPYQDPYQQQQQHMHYQGQPEHGLQQEDTPQWGHGSGDINFHEPSQGWQTEHPRWRTRTPFSSSMWCATAIFSSPNFCNSNLQFSLLLG